MDDIQALQQFEISISAESSSVANTCSQSRDQSQTMLFLIWRWSDWWLLAADARARQAIHVMPFEIWRAKPQVTTSEPPPTTPPYGYAPQSLLHAPLELHFG